MISKKIKAVRTYRFRIVNDDFDDKFKQLQVCRRTYYNYALQYLYQHYGYKKLQVYFPKTVTEKNFLISKLKKYARSKCDIKDYNVQSIDVMLMELLVAFQKYRQGQLHIKYWSNKTKEKYLKEHNCNLSGFRRINYKHSDQEVKSATFKQQIHHNPDGSLKDARIYLVNNYAIKIPFLGTIQVKESLTNLKHKHLVLATVKRRANGDYELQPKFKVNIQRKSLKEELASLDVNSANNQLYAFNDGRIDGMPQELIKKLSKLDWKSRQYQDYLKHHCFDNSVKTRLIKVQKQKVLTKISNLTDAFQIQQAKLYTRIYPFLAMEDLKVFTMRTKSKRLKDKRINHKLALIKPSTFKQQMITAYENAGSTLLLVNPYDTSKQCSVCHYIYNDLKVGQKEWTCPNCHVRHNRDHNATINIRDFALHPELHPVLKKFAYLTVDDIITTI